MALYATLEGVRHLNQIGTARAVLTIIPLKVRRDFVFSIPALVHHVFLSMMLLLVFMLMPITHLGSVTVSPIMELLVRSVMGIGSLTLQSSITFASPTTARTKIYSTVQQNATLISHQPQPSLAAASLPTA
jgi:hypothetical protein